LSSTVIFSPAKLNLFLAVTGPRPDGFHDLVSVAAPVAWGDTLRVRLAEGGFALECDDPEVPCDGRNLVLKAAEAFKQAAAPRLGPAASGLGAAFVLEKRIPMGAGLGGGSSNAVAAMRALNELTGAPLDVAALEGLAARLGSDCPLFLKEAPVAMRGRGERVETMRDAQERLRGRRVLIFKPGFGIGTAWAYEKLAASAGFMLPAEAEARLEAWRGDPSAPVEKILFNSFEPVAFRKFQALPLLLGRLRANCGLEPRLSGSGSACFALLPGDRPAAAADATAEIRQAWGPAALVVDTHFG
jgi:4-diphosphocytidyl-2-C-methyl-D-erythritol kinase